MDSTTALDPLRAATTFLRDASNNIDAADARDYVSDAIANLYDSECRVRSIKETIVRQLEGYYSEFAELEKIEALNSQAFDHLARKLPELVRGTPTEFLVARDSNSNAETSDSPSDSVLKDKGEVSKENLNSVPQEDSAANVGAGKTNTSVSYLTKSEFEALPKYLGAVAI
ncbi:hypothetical protein HDU83_002654 [Entophlyctis luteolus]|nr:hypothetical protein HDU83_002654 [Entophlyctis luteolus]